MRRSQEDEWFWEEGLHWWLNHPHSNLMFCLDGGFDPQLSLYKNFVSPAELFSDLLSRERADEIFNGFELETGLRLALYRVLQKESHKPGSGVRLDALSEKVSKELTAISEPPSTIT